MIKKYKNLYISIIILIQSALSIFIGLLIFFLITQRYIAPGVYIANVNVGKLDRIEATQKVEKVFGQLLETQSFNIVLDNNEKFNIKYSDISAHINSADTISKVVSDKNAFIYKFNGYFVNKKK